MGEILMNVEEASDYLGMCEATIRSWVKRGILPHRRIGPRRQIMFTQEDLEKVITVETVGKK